MSLGLKELELVLAQMMKHMGYKKKGKMWYRHTPDCVFRIDIQKSDWGEQFYINIGIFIKAIEPIEVPPLFDSHIIGRLGYLVPDYERWSGALDFENASEHERRAKAEEVARAIKEFALPFLDSLSTLAQIKQRLYTLKETGFLVQRKVHELLGEPMD